jgi:transcriptional regulator of met regulon
MIGLFLGLGRIPIMIIAGMAIVSAFYGWLLVHDHDLKNEIISEFNTKQEELLREKESIFVSQLQELQKRNDTLVLQSKEKEVVYETQIITIEKEVQAKDKNDEAPEYYKQLLKQMQKTYGDKK